MFDVKKPFVIFLYGLPSSGKTSLANNVKEKINGDIAHLDGDDIRKNVSKDLGFSGIDRIENHKRILDLVEESFNSNTPSIVSIILPYNSSRVLNREKFGSNYIQIYLDCPLFECERRDVKGLYKKARFGEIRNFTGVDSEFEISQDNDLVVETEHLSVDFCGDLIIKFLCDSNFLDCDF